MPEFKHALACQTFKVCYFASLYNNIETGKNYINRPARRSKSINQTGGVGGHTTVNTVYFCVIAAC